MLTKTDGVLNQEVVAELIKDVSDLKDKGVQIAIISSGAVNLGRSVPELKDRNFKLGYSGQLNPNTLREQILAAIGQPKLMAAYEAGFLARGYHCAQILVTRADFSDRKRYLNLRAVVEELLRLGVIPIFNENDVLASEEIDFSDNDQLAMMVSAMLNADQLFILTNVDGVYDRPPLDGSAARVAEIADVSKFLDEFEIKGKSSTGKGGMKSKLICAGTLTSLGISVSVGTGLVENPISRLIDAKNGTFFPVAERKEKASKAWIVAASTPSGRITVSTYLAEILRNKRPASVLLAGVDNIEGKFEKQDVVEICDDNGTVLGRGVARFGSEELSTKIKWYRSLPDEEQAQIKSADAIVVHYDYFAFM